MREVTCHRTTIGSHLIYHGNEEFETGVLIDGGLHLGRNKPHRGEQHLQRYLAEFDFRMNTRMKLDFDDATRAAMIVKGATGKRLTCRQVG